MLTLIWFLSIAFLFSAFFVWLLDHNGHVVITWLGYQIEADILTTITFAALFSLIAFAISYVVARLLAIKFPSLLRALFKRSYIRSLEKLVLKHRRGFDAMVELMLALEISDKKSATEIYKTFRLK